jgi:hypothetical protein
MAHHTEDQQSRCLYSPAQRTAALVNDPVNENVKIRIGKPT